MSDERWVRIGRDDDGDVFVTRGIDDEHMRTVRFGDGTEDRFRPDAARIPWLDSLTHWDLMPSEVKYVTEVGEPAAPPWPPPPWRSLVDDGSLCIAPVGTPAPYPPRHG